MEKNTCTWLIGADNEETRGSLPQEDNSQRANYQKRHSIFVCCALSPLFFFLGSENDWRTVIAQNCRANTLFFFFFVWRRRRRRSASGNTHKFFLVFFLQLTGQAKLKGKTILDLSFLTELLKEKVFPPRTGVDPIPKLQGPAAETRDWYSFRQTLKNVSHSSRVHFLSAVFRVPSQHMPLSSSPFTLCIDKICNSNCPDPSDTCWETEQWMQWKTLTSLYVLNIYIYISSPTLFALAAGWLDAILHEACLHVMLAQPCT